MTDSLKGLSIGPVQDNPGCSECHKLYIDVAGSVEIRKNEQAISELWIKDFSRARTVGLHVLDTDRQPQGDALLTLAVRLYDGSPLLTSSYTGLFEPPEQEDDEVRYGLLVTYLDGSTKVVNT